MARALLSIALVLTPALCATAAHAQVPTVTISRPGDGSTLRADACASPGLCTGKVNLRVEVSAAAALSRVDLTYRPLERSWFSTYNLCGVYDLIEPDGGEPCGSSTSLSLAHTVSLREGQTHELIVMAEDVRGSTGTARVTVTVQAPSLPQIGAATLTATDPTFVELIPPLRDPASVPEQQARFVSGEIVTLFGDNLDLLARLNDRLAMEAASGSEPPVVLEAYLSPMLGEYDEQYQPSGGLPTGEWCKHKADLVDKGNDPSRGPYIRVRVPEVPEQVLVDCRFGGTLTRARSQVFWRWIVRDKFDRPERVHEYHALPDPYLPRAKRTVAFRIQDAPYPYLHGFGFENEMTPAKFDEYLAVYGYNAYVCLGLGLCLSHVIDPVYAVLYPVYDAVLAEANGSCVGMASTSLLMRRGFLSPQDFDPAVLYPAGFIEQDYRAEYATSSRLGRVTEPPHPVNLWATIRVNHGVQVSAEFIGRLLAQVGSTQIEQYLDIQQHPLTYVTSMWTTGKGHVVTPYGATGNEIAVYDNNDPGTERVIPVDPAGGWVNYNDKQYLALANFPISLWREGRHMPLDLPHLWYSLVFGEADASYESDGGRWGWDAQGVFADSLPGAVPVAPLGADADSRKIPILLPDDRATQALINTRGAAYTYNASRGGNVVQLRVGGATPGEIDQVSLGTGDGPREIAFTPGLSPRTLTAVVGLAAVERERIVFALSGLRASAGGRLGFQGDATARAVRYANTSNEATRHLLLVSAVDGPSASTSSRAFGPFDVPAGAVLTASIEDWPAASRIAWQLDSDGNGTADARGVSQGSDCAPDDLDTDGLPDACQAIAVGAPARVGEEGCACSLLGSGRSAWPAALAVFVALGMVVRRRRSRRGADMSAAGD